MATLRKKALTLPQNGSSGSEDMLKSDSVMNLTKPLLYGIYNDDLLLSLNDQIEINVPPSRNSRLMESEAPEPESLVKLLPIITKVAILALSAYVYNEVVAHIHGNLFTDKQVKETLKLANVFILSFIQKFSLSHYVELPQDLAILDQIFLVVVQGLLFGLLVVVVDRITPKLFSSRILTSNPNPNRKQDVINEVLRSSICFLGISYAVRNLEWKSLLQVSMMWSLINPALWIMLDGTFNGLVTALAVVLAALAVIYWDNASLLTNFEVLHPDDTVSLWLWIASFFFCGSIIFGKIGRSLFQ